MLQNSLFYIITETHNDLKATFGVGVNWQHPLFGAHFPGQPIMPGACMVQIAVELFSYLQKRSYLLTETGNVKFLQMVNPEIRDGVTFGLSWEEDADGICNVRVVVTENEQVLSRMLLKLKSE